MVLKDMNQQLENHKNPRLGDWSEFYNRYDPTKAVNMKGISNDK